MEFDEVKLKIKTDSQKLVFLKKFLIRFREQLRKEREFETADMIRNALSIIGIKVKDKKLK